MSDGAYLLEAAVFVEAARRLYPFGREPGFWDKLLYWAQAGLMRSIDRVRDELKSEGDELASWVQGPMRPYFASTNDQATVDAYGEVMRWAYTSGAYDAVQVDPFGQRSDAWLLAHALATGGTVVTVPAQGRAAHRIAVAAVAPRFGVRVVTLGEMLATFETGFTRAG